MCDSGFGRTGVAHFSWFPVNVALSAVNKLSTGFRLLPYSDRVATGLPFLTKLKGSVSPLIFNLLIMCKSRKQILLKPLTLSVNMV